MKILSVVAFAVFFIAASHTPVQAGEKLPFFQMSSPEKGTSVQTEIVPISIQEDGVESVFIQCGNDPDGDWRCVRTEFDDGGDCLFYWVEGFPLGFTGDDC